MFVLAALVLMCFEEYKYNNSWYVLVNIYSKSIHGIFLPFGRIINKYLTQYFIIFLLGVTILASSDIGSLFRDHLKFEFTNICLHDKPLCHKT